MTPTSTTYTNAILFTSEGPVEGAITVSGQVITSVSLASTTSNDSALSDRTVDLDGRFVLPGFIDCHTHLLMLGQSLQKVQLREAQTPEDIQAALRAAREADPGAQRILGSGWLYSATGPEGPHRDLLDAAVSDIPVYLDANDLHSVWVNTAALTELGITADTEDPIGGTIARDPASGAATGMILETAAQQIVWPALARQATDADRDLWLESAMGHYIASGVTSVVDMAVGQDDLDAFQRAEERHGGHLPLRIKGHWFIHRRATVEENLEQVAKAAELAETTHSTSLKMVGIKLVLDGVIDSCTAAMKEPYVDGTLGEPIWDREALIPVVAAADAAGLQIAIHAIGDEASDIALDTLEAAYEQNGPLERRHRIEHLETVTQDNVRRLAALNVIASMQPVHADPAIQENWRAVLGDERTERAYPWTEFVDAGATLALSTDAPTAPHAPLPNMFVATTRKSALDPNLPANLPKYALGLQAALQHATKDAAYSCRAEGEEGNLAPGFFADFAVLDGNPFDDRPEALLHNSPVLVVTGGQVRFDAYTRYNEVGATDTLANGF
jgi:predicted amidohydrolase YtcJ